ncbi:MAG: 50S ribosomal protein L11 [Alphaproteobacteria bacterium]|nr:50S ribosomal protein L11 [Rickettsiales bacterium]
MSLKTPSGKKPVSIVKLQVEAGKANPAPPIGTALGPKGINIMQFCNEFNKQTESMKGMLVPAVISIFKDRSFSFILKKPPVSNLIKSVLNLKSGSKEPGRVVIGKITKSQIKQIAETKMSDLNCFDIDAAVKMVAGTATSMGFEVIEG